MTTNRGSMGEWEHADDADQATVQRRPVVIETEPAKVEQDKEEERAPLVMPGPEAEVAEEIAEVGVEGRPADAKAGPRMLWYELAFAGALIVAAAVGVGIWLNWIAGFVVLGLGLLALLFNPVVGATLNRAHDRDLIAKRHIRHP